MHGNGNKERPSKVRRREAREVKRHAAGRAINAMFYATTPPTLSRCAFALGRGDYCVGDVRYAETHNPACPEYFDPENAS